MFSDADLRTVAKALGIRSEALLDHFALRLEGAATAYYWAIEQERSYPTRKQIKAALIAIEKLATSLARILRDLDEISARWLGNAILGFPHLFKQLDDSFPSIEGQRLACKSGLKDLSRDLEYLAGCALYLKAHIKMPPRGRRGNRQLSAVIGHLEDLYTTFTKASSKTAFSYSRRDKRYGGPFFLFVEMCIRRIDPTLRLSNNSLGEHIRRCMGWR